MYQVCGLKSIFASGNFCDVHCELYLAMSLKKNKNMLPGLFRIQNDQNVTACMASVTQLRKILYINLSFTGYK